VNMRINRNSPIPIYAQIAEQLREIAQKMYSEGKSRFLTYDELIQLFGVSRMTIRQAVQELVNEGILKLIQGSGTFIVRQEKLATDIEKLDTFFRGWYLKDFSVQLLFRDIVPCPADVAQKFRIDENSEVMQIKRRRLSGGIPVVVDNRYILKTFGDQITDDELIHYSFSHIFLSKFQMQFTQANLEIEAILATEVMADELGVDMGSPILHRYTDLVVDNYGCILTGNSAYRGDMYRYRSVLHNN
jgi:DNA-binding GntR family transcriptional regulator